MKLDPCETFKVLSVGTRIRIIDLLKSKGPLGVKNISKELGITPAAVSQHFKILRQAGLVRNKRKGYWIPYSIDEEALENCRCILNEVCACGCEVTRKFKKQELNKVRLESLMEYKRELERELRNIQSRISAIRTERR